MKNTFNLFFAIIVAILMSSCRSTQLISSWVSPSLQDSVPVKKVLVFSLLGRQDNQVQDQFEDAVVAQLNAAGVQAASAFDIFGPDALKGKQSGEIAEKIQKSGYTDILLMTLLDKSKQTTYVPGAAYPVAVPAYYPWFPPFYGCYSYYYGVVTTPGYFSTDTNFIVESRLYNVGNEKDAIYVVQTETTNPDGLYDMASGVAKTITEDMAGKGLISK